MKTIKQFNSGTILPRGSEEAVLVLECASVEEAQGFLAELPFVREGLIAFEMIPLRAYPGFERLFT